MRGTYPEARAAILEALTPAIAAGILHDPDVPALAVVPGGSTNVFPGADFQYLSANVVVDATGKTLFPAYGVKRFPAYQGSKVKVGFIGEVLKGTPTIVTPTGVAGLTFQDEALSMINRLAVFNNVRI